MPGKTGKERLSLIGNDVGMRTGIESCPGTATIVLPIRGGRAAVPYPFVPPKG